MRKQFKTKVLWILQFTILLMSAGTLSDMGKLPSTQNHFGLIGQSQFTTKNNTRVIAQKGGLAILPCVVKLNSPATVSWIRRRDFQLLTVGLSTHSSDKRFLVEHTRHMGHWSLRIKSVREEDKGLYECQLSIYPTSSIFVELKVVEAVAEISGGPELHIDEGSALRLDCRVRRATENPAFVFWYHDNKMVNYDTQNGFYVTSTLMKSSLEPNSILSSNNATFKEHNSASLRNSISIGNNTLYSKHQNTVLPANNGQVNQANYLNMLSISSLAIHEVNFHHGGNYTCAPSNARSASITVHVLRGEKPAAMQHANRSFIDFDGSNSNISVSFSRGGVLLRTSANVWIVFLSNFICIFQANKFNVVKLILMLYLSKISKTESNYR